jgi:hypothetical protein
MSGIPIRGGIATARDAACTYTPWAAWGEAEAPWCAPDCGQVQPMDHGTTMRQRAAASVPIADTAAWSGWEPIP